MRLALFAFVLSVLTVGWIVPMGSQEMTWPFSRYRDDGQAEQREMRPGSLWLNELLLQAGSAPEVRQELLRRATRIAPSFLMPLFAGVLVMVRPRWTYKSSRGCDAGSVCHFGMGVLGHTVSREPRRRKATKIVMPSPS